MDDVVRAMREKAAYAAKSAEHEKREEQSRCWRSIAKAWDEAADMVEMRDSRNNQTRWYQVVVTDVDSDGAPQGVNRIVAIVRGSDEAMHMAKAYDRDIGVGMYEQVDIISDGRFVSW